MGVYPDFVEAFFPASDQVSDAEFKVTIQRDDLSYWIEVAPTEESRADNSIPARLSGRCSILDGHGFLTVRPKGAQVRQTLRKSRQGDGCSDEALIVLGSLVFAEVLLLA